MEKLKESIKEILNTSGVGEGVKFKIYSAIDSYAKENETKTKEQETAKKESDHKDIEATIRKAMRGN